MLSMITPMPPNHCMVDRHNRSPRDWAPMQSSVFAKQFGEVDTSMMVVPVVVNPDIASNPEWMRPSMAARRVTSAVNGP